MFIRRTKNITPSTNKIKTKYNVHTIPVNTVNVVVASIDIEPVKTTIFNLFYNVLYYGIIYSNQPFTNYITNLNQYYRFTCEIIKNENTAKVLFNKNSVKSYEDFVAVLINDEEVIDKLKDVVIEYNYIKYKDITLQFDSCIYININVLDITNNKNLLNEIRIPDSLKSNKLCNFEDNIFKIIFPSKYLSVSLLSE